MPPPSTELSVVVHPIVLLSVVDHHTRVAKSSKKRVVGILLGSDSGHIINVANSFAGLFLPSFLPLTVLLLPDTDTDSTNHQSHSKKMNGIRKPGTWTTIL